MADKGKCKYLSANYGIGCYICLWELKPIDNADRCATCEYHSEKEKEDE